MSPKVGHSAPCGPSGRSVRQTDHETGSSCVWHTSIVTSHVVAPVFDGGCGCRGDIEVDRGNCKRAASRSHPEYRHNSGRRPQQRNEAGVWVVEGV